MAIIFRIWILPKSDPKNSSAKPLTFWSITTDFISTLLNGIAFLLILLLFFTLGHPFLFLRRLIGLTFLLVGTIIICLTTLNTLLLFIITLLYNLNGCLLYFSIILCILLTLVLFFRFLLLLLRNLLHLSFLNERSTYQFSHEVMRLGFWFECSLCLRKNFSFPCFLSTISTTNIHLSLYLTFFNLLLPQIKNQILLSSLIFAQDFFLCIFFHLFYFIIDFCLH